MSIVLLRGFKGEKTIEMAKVVPLLPDGTPSILSEDEVTIARLQAVLDSVLMECEIGEDGDLVVGEGLAWPCWVSIDEIRQLIQIYSIATPIDGAEKEVADLVNDLNKAVIVVQFSYDYDDDCVWGNYWMTYETGLNIRQFIKMLRRFASAFEITIRTVGEGKLK